MTNFTKRVMMSVAGVLTGAVSVAVFKTAAFGVDPFQSFMSGIDKLIPIEFGTLYMIVNALLLVFSLIFACGNCRDMYCFIAVYDSRPRCFHIRCNSTYLCK